VNEHVDARFAGDGAVGEERRAHALARAAGGLVAHGADGEVDLIGVRFGGGGDRIEARLEFAERADEVGGRELHIDACMQHIDHMMERDGDTAARTATEMREQIAGGLPRS